MNFDVIRIYEGSDGNATKDLYAQLETRGPAGLVAMNLFRAQKCSERAKKYRGRGYKQLAYGRKEWSISLLCDVLTQHAAALNIRWGWGIDHNQPRYPHVFYVDTPTGQVSFHTGNRLAGPDYPHEWVPGEGSVVHMLKWVSMVMDDNAHQSDLERSLSGFIFNPAEANI